MRKGEYCNIRFVLFVGLLLVFARKKITYIFKTYNFLEKSILVEPQWWRKMASVIAFRAVDRGFEPRSGQTNDCKIGICCFSAKHAAFRRKRKNGWL